MPHFKCVPCRTRLNSRALTPGLVGDLCPSCGSLLEPVGVLSEVVGFRSIKPRDSEAAGEALGTHHWIADRFDEFLDRRHASLVQEELDAERWLDEGGSFHAEAVALSRPETSL